MSEIASSHCTYNGCTGTIGYGHYGKSKERCYFHRLCPEPGCKNLGMIMCPISLCEECYKLLDSNDYEK